MSEIHPITPDVKGTTLAHEGFYNLKIDQLRLPSGMEMSYTVLETKHDAVAILAETKQGSFIILKEFRYPTGKWLLGCPGGRIDSGETLVQAAKRELLEETGHSAEEFILLGGAYPFSAVTSQKIYYIFAKGATRVCEPALEPFELIRTQEMQLSELYQKIKEGADVDGVLCTALFFRSIHDKS
ncbi:MAG: NUDIX hydrolase [Chlamydiae bacterium]|nr:NUDIX hydrolase [Chlamydiota bacterium]